MIPDRSVREIVQYIRPTILYKLAVHSPRKNFPQDIWVNFLRFCMRTHVPLFIDELLGPTNPTIIRCLSGHIRNIECKNSLLNFPILNLTCYKLRVSSVGKKRDPGKNRDPGFWLAITAVAICFIWSIEYEEVWIVVIGEWFTRLIWAWRTWLYIQIIKSRHFWKYL